MFKDHQVLTFIPITFNFILDFSLIFRNDTIRVFVHLVTIRLLFECYMDFFFLIFCLVKFLVYIERVKEIRFSKLLKITWIFFFNCSWTKNISKLAQQRKKILYIYIVFLILECFRINQFWHSSLRLLKLLTGRQFFVDFSKWQN